MSSGNLKHLFLEVQPWCFDTLKALHSGLDRKLIKYNASKKIIRKENDKTEKTYIKKLRYAIIFCEHASSLDVITHSQWVYLGELL
jgi:hypothetical protein